MRPYLHALSAAVFAFAIMAEAVLPTVYARGQDVCPEPNNTYQAACYLGPGSDALGFISVPNDTDAYRIEVLDFNTDVHVELADRPFPYRVELANWNGDVIASSRDGTIDTTVDMPGSYYIFVDSPGGQFSDSTPYNIFRQLSYPGSSIPQILWSGEFRPGGNQGWTGSTQYADHHEKDGRYTIAMKIAGSAAEPSQAWAWWGPEFSDFTMTVDARVANNVDAGYQVFFRWRDDANNYFVTVDARDGNVALSKTVNGQIERLAGWAQTDSINTSGGVNRTVIRAAGADILVAVNGENVFVVQDGSHRSGKFAFGAIAWADPPIVNFDNIIVTTPSEG